MGNEKMKIKIRIYKVKESSNSLVLVVFFFFVLILSCNPTAPSGFDSKSDIELIEEELEIPVLVGFPQGGEIIDTLGQLESRNFPFNIEQQMGQDIVFDDSLDYQKFERDGWDKPYSKSNNIELIVDENQIFAWKFWELHLKPVLEIDEHGKEISIPLYHSPYDMVMKFPVFIYNPTDSTQLVENHDGRLIFVQEAKTKEGEWKAIEYFVFSECGNSYKGCFIKSKRFLMFGINKYKGDFKTKFRVRLQTNGKIVFSNEYWAFINYSQFENHNPSILINPNC